MLLPGPPAEAVHPGTGLCWMLWGSWQAEHSQAEFTGLGPISLQDQHAEASCTSWPSLSYSPFLGASGSYLSASPCLILFLGPQCCFPCASCHLEPCSIDSDLWKSVLNSLPVSGTSFLLYLASGLYRPGPSIDPSPAFLWPQMPNFNISSRLNFPK